MQFAARFFGLASKANSINTDTKQMTSCVPGNLFLNPHRDKAESAPKLDYHQSIQLYIFPSQDEEGFTRIKCDCKAPQNTLGQPIH